MSITPDEARTVLLGAEQLYTRAEIERVLDRMAEDITATLSGKNPLVLCVMVGGMVFAGQLVTRLNFPLEIDYLHATRYRGEIQGGELHWLHHPSHSLSGRTVLLLDDILDEGVTLAAILKACRAEGASEVLTGVLVEKIHDRKADIRADFIGVEVDDKYVFGYGMDYKGYLRNSPGIYAARN